jgi:hypothetical protein
MSPKVLRQKHVVSSHDSARPDHRKYELKIADDVLLVGIDEYKIKPFP